MKHIQISGPTENNYVNLPSDKNIWSLYLCLFARGDCQTDLQASKMHSPLWFWRTSLDWKQLLLVEQLTWNYFFFLSSTRDVKICLTSVRSKKYECSFSSVDSNRLGKISSFWHYGPQPWLIIRAYIPQYTKTAQSIDQSLESLPEAQLLLPFFH